MPTNQSSDQFSSTSDAGSSDVKITQLFNSICAVIPGAKRAADLTALRKLLADINFELTKYGVIPLSAEVWKPKLQRLVEQVLRSVQVHSAFTLDVKDVESEITSMIDHLLNSFVSGDGVKDSVEHLDWHLHFAASCARDPALPGVRAYGYWKIGELRKNVEISPETVQLFLPMIVFLVDGFKENDSVIANSASEAILHLVKYFHITNILQPSFAFAAKLGEIVGGPTNTGSMDVVRFRVFEFLNKLLMLSASNITDIMQIGIMEQLYASFRTVDLLVLANNCETLCQLASHAVGLQLLEESGGMKIASDLLVTQKDSDKFEYFAPYLLRMYITLAMKFPEYCILKCENVTWLACDLVLKINTHSGAAALEYLSQLACCSSTGKLYLHNLMAPHGRIITDDLQHIGRIISGSLTGTPMDDACLRSLAMMIKRVAVPVQQTDVELQEINHMWFQMIGVGVFAKLLQKAQKPFKDVKMPVFMVFKAMAEQKWGQEVFRDEPGFMEYLLNRQAEVDKDVKEIKFAIISTLIATTTFSEVFDSVTVIRLREYVQDGPYYVRGVHQVSFEGGS